MIETVTNFLFWFIESTLFTIIISITALLAVFYMVYIKYNEVRN